MGERRSAFDAAELVYDLAVHRRQPVASEIVARTLDTIGRGHPVLDLGAGQGRIALEIEARTAVRVTTSDVDEAAVRRARSAPSGGTVVADGVALPFADESFAAVYLVHVLHHVADQPRLVAEAHRVLWPGGRLIVVEFDATSRLVSVFRFLARLTGRRCWFHSPESLGRLLETGDFVARVRGIDRATFVAVGQRRASSIHGPGDRSEHGGAYSARAPRETAARGDF